MILLPTREFSRVGLYQRLALLPYCVDVDVPCACRALTPADVRDAGRFLVEVAGADALAVSEDDATACEAASSLGAPVAVVHELAKLVAAARVTASTLASIAQSATAEAAGGTASASNAPPARATASSTATSTTRGAVEARPSPACAEPAAARLAAVSAATLELDVAAASRIGSS